jgi:hypothetical protein
MHLECMEKMEGSACTRIAQWMQWDVHWSMIEASTGHYSCGVAKETPLSKHTREATTSPGRVFVSVSVTAQHAYEERGLSEHIDIRRIRYTSRSPFLIDTL